uniref:HypC/HybG/HupF family hydrogenase formation chaperone n=1 Tax=Ignisphaera aggregans TaxID=334771 RepID=A0A7C2V8S9_9CREN
MCWGTPAIVIDVDEKKMMAKVDFGDGIYRDALIGISSDRVTRGDIVIVHAGVIISKLSLEGVLEQIAFIKETMGDEAADMLKPYENLVSIAKALRDRDNE